jgi:4'-phosphopantetheinyl transferase EntD
VQLTISGMAKLVPESVSICELTGSAIPDPLFPEEETLVRRAVSKRRNEFALSRTCARRALTNLGVAPCSILSTSDRAPIWPPGIVGSITHCHSYTAAAVCSDLQFRSVGIDAEINQPLPAGVLTLIALPSEQLAISQLPDQVICWDRLLFSAKECIFKAWFPIARRWLDFRDAAVTIDPVRGTFVAELLIADPPTGKWLNGRFGLSGSHLLSAILLPVR